MIVKKQTPLLIVDAIEPVLPFWTGPLGYTKVMDMPVDGHLVFAMLERDGQTLMLQTAASIREDLGAKTPAGLKAGAIGLYIDIDNIDEAVAMVRTSAAPIVTGPRETNYGAKEIWCEAPNGFVLGFAQH